MRLRGLTCIAIVAGLCTVTAVGCGDESASTSTSETAGAGASAYLQEAKARLDKAVTPESYGQPPATAPTPKKGAKVALISCGQNLPGCARGIDEAERAAKELGWSTTVFDTKGDPNTAGEGIRQAVTAGVDGIFTYLIDCQYVKAALAEAKEAGVPVINSEGRDCPTPQFAGTLEYQDLDGPADFEQWYHDFITLQVDYAAVKQDGDANILFFGDDTSFVTRKGLEAVKEQVKKCGTCKLSTVIFPLTAVGTTLQARAEEALLKNPEANTIIVPYSDALLGGVEPAVRQSGRDMLMSTGEGIATAMDLVRTKKSGFGVCLPAEWEGWAAIDGLVRLMVDKPMVNSGIGLQLYDPSNNLVPPGEPCKAPVDFRAGFRKAWGLT